jgi:hypothetical protein
MRRQFLKIYFANTRPDSYFGAKGKIMPKPKKSDSEKAAKDKSPKIAKAEKPAKEKKKAPKKELDAMVEPPVPVVAIAAPVAEKPAKGAKAATKKASVEVKKPAAKPIKIATSAPAVASEPEIEISADDISLRAYFIAERRQAMGWPGDSTSDWVEAERQLKAEAKRKK